MNDSVEWQGKRVLVLGMARSGIAVSRLLCRYGAVPLLNDRKTAAQLGEDVLSLRDLPCEWHLGEETENLFPGTDVLLISPGVPIDSPVVLAAREAGIPVTGELEVASQLAEGTLVALTGTNGKTTTVTLLGEIFRAAGKIAYVAGNVGYPLSAAAMESRPEDVLVAEVSSFQLETADTFHPRIASVLNVTEDHLNRHYTMENYAAVKRRIFQRQNDRDTAVLNWDDPLCRRMAEGLKARVAWFSRTQSVQQGAFVKDGRITIRLNGEEKSVCGVDEVYIPGPHNTENALAASVMASAMGVPAAVIRHVLRTFRGVEHRIEFVRELDGVKWYNDSKGTNVDSTIKAVQSMRAPTVLILGGSDKHVSFDTLAQEIVKSGQIARVVLCGATAPQIGEALEKAGYTALSQADNYPDMVQLCRTLAVPGGNVLLSPACASFDQFTDYEQRGRVFKQLVNAL
ncbi:MAG: UDP-N-acetylmuramoyl-L-alanine--D-glutamate ligase [Clostridia bacterium]|nr:UDP-N-acetylmuramoyl-L-alanine--D-glutamate ligase [Clostridia bacterium]